MPEDFSSEAIAVDDLPDFSGDAVVDRPPESNPVFLPGSEQWTPDQLTSVAVAAQRLDPRWAEPRPPEPTVGGLIGQAMEYINDPSAIRATPPILPPLPPMGGPETQEGEEAVQKRLLAERIYEAEHPIRSGIVTSAEKLVEGVTSPAGIAGLAATPFAAPIMLPVWAALGTEGSLDAIQRIQKARETGDRKAYYEAVGDLTVNAPMAGGIVKAPSARFGVTFPRSLQALGEEPAFSRSVIEAKVKPGERAGIQPEQEVANAISESQAAKVHEPVPPQPIEGTETVPAEEGGVRVPPSEEAKPEVPLTEAVKPVEAEATKPVAEKAGETQPAVPVSEPEPQTITVQEEGKASAMTAGEGAIPSAASPKRQQAERPPDIIDDIQGQIGKLSITSAREIREKFKPAGAARKLFTRSGGFSPDVALDTLHREGLWRNIETEDQFLQAIEDAVSQRKAQRGQKSGEQREIDRQLSQRKDFQRAAFEGRRGPGEPKKTDRIDTGELLEGDEFMLAGVKVRVKELRISPDTGEVAYVVLEDGRRFETQTVGTDQFIEADSGTLIRPEEPPESPSPKKQKTELFEETPFNLSGENLRQSEESKPPIAETGQTELFELQKVTATPDPIKSADAAEALYGGPKQAIATLERQLRTLDADPYKKGQQFDPEQRARLKQVLALLRERADQSTIGEGPGAKTAGAPKYPAIQQLTDQLEATPKVGTKERLRIGEKIADAWSKKGDAWTKAVGKMRNAWSGLKTWQEGIRRASDLDSRLGEYDYAIQYSSAASKRAGEAIQRQMRDVTDREAAAILIDSARIAKDPNNPAEVRQVIKDGLDLLPADTPKRIRAAMERALDPSLELRQFSEQLKQYFGIREQDAVGADLFSEGLTDYYTHIWKKESNMPESLRSAIASGRVNTYFQFARQRKIPTLIEGILEGKIPVLDPAKVIPFYNFTMDRAIASREFIKALHDLRATDGRPAVDVRGGVVIQDPLDISSPALVKPKTQAKEIADYKPVNHSALQKWKWLTKTPEGRDIMLRGDMVVHPEFHEALSRFMDKDRMSYSKAMRVALTIGSTAKAAKLGVLPSTFHIVHVGTHAAFHWTNPFKWAPIDFEAPATRFAIEKGHLKLAPSPAELAVFEEGVSGGLLRKIPLYGKWIGAFSDFMFHQYIPRLKLNTFENAMARARSPLTTTGRALRAGRMTENDLAARIGDASNSAFGELNSLFLNKFGRSPETQRMLRLIFLAPDFGEARLRFAAKAFARYGDEERLAIATMLGVLWFGARLGNWLSHGNAEADDPRHAFEVKMKDQLGLLGKKDANHWVGMRSVVGDVAHLVDRPGQFMYVRLSPAYSRPITDFLFGRDERTGRKLDWEEKAVRIAQAWQPIGLGGMTEPDRTMQESLFQSIGLSNRRDRLVSDVARKANEWREKQGLLPVVEIIPTDQPSYLKLRTALNIGKTEDAKRLINDLLKTRSVKQLEKAMADYYDHPYNGSLELEKAWAKTWTQADAEMYLQAQEEKKQTIIDFYKVLGDVMQERNK